MENMNIEDLEKVVEEAKALRAKRISEIKEKNEQAGIELDEEEIKNHITIEYLNKMKLVNGKGELVEKDVFMTIEQIDGQFQIRYYDKDQKLLGSQRTIDREIMLPRDEFLLKNIDYAKSLKEQLEKKDKQETKTLEELEQKLNQIKGNQNQEHKIEGPQLTQEQVNRLDGPKIEIQEQKAHGETIAQSIGLTGRYIQFIDIDEARKLIPNLEISSGEQKFMPIEIFEDGTANAISEDILSFSTIEGGNSTIEHVTVDVDGTRKREQNIETFNINNKAGMHTISISFDEGNMNSTHYEIEYGVRDKQQPSRISQTEILNQEAGNLKEDKQQEESILDYDEGETIASKEPASEEQVRRYAEAKGIYFDGTRTPDIERARKKLEYDTIGNKSIEQVIEEAEEGQMQLGQNNNY